MEIRKAKMIVNKSGSGSYTFRATLPANWIREMDLDEENRDLILSFDGNKITIQNIKGDVEMLKYNELMNSLEEITGGDVGRLDKKYSKEEFEESLNVDITKEWEKCTNWKSNEYETQDFTFNIDVLDEDNEILDVSVYLEVDENDMITHINHID